MYLHLPYRMASAIPVSPARSLTRSVPLSLMVPFISVRYRAAPRASIDGTTDGRESALCPAASGTDQPKSQLLGFGCALPSDRYIMPLAQRTMSQRTKDT